MKGLMAELASAMGELWEKSREVEEAEAEAEEQVEEVGAEERRGRGRE